eukprot:TRINITY_DN4146_c0_g1_i2.p1 TRINITY_DN4146_c0_g1~~TRINITY_DN4146_c0_g1_i2.p1  ORF type:complete len:365 (+),score=105.63 TRINITY_DN4146_c0_g1_i2:76-1170(+)
MSSIDTERCRAFWDSVPQAVLADEIKSGDMSHRLSSDTTAKRNAKVAGAKIFAEESALVSHDSLVGVRKFVESFQHEQNLSGDVESIIYERLKTMGIEEFLQSAAGPAQELFFSMLPINCRTVVLAAKLLLVRSMMFLFESMKESNKKIVLDFIAPTVEDEKMRLKLLATRMGVCVEKKNQPSTEQSGSISTAGEDTQEEIQITDAPAPTIAPVASAPQIDVKSDKIAQSIEILMHKTVNQISGLAKANGVKLLSKLKKDKVEELVRLLGPEIAFMEAASVVSEASSVMDEEVSRSGAEKNKENDEENLPTKTPGRGKRRLDRPATVAKLEQKSSKRAKTATLPEPVDPMVGIHSELNNTAMAM